MHATMVNGAPTPKGAPKGRGSAAPVDPAADFIPLGGSPRLCEFKTPAPSPRIPVTRPDHQVYSRAKRKRESSDAERHSRGGSPEETAQQQITAASRVTGTQNVRGMRSEQKDVSDRTSGGGGGGGSIRKKNETSDAVDAANPSARSPWTPSSRTYARGIIGLHEEIEDFFQWMVPSPQEHQLRVNVITRIRGIVNELWPCARVDVFGSFRTGLYLPSSDIDLVIVGHWQEMPLRTLERVLLEKDIVEPDSLKVLDKAAVPIVKLTDKQSKIKVDICFNMPNGLRAAELIKHYRKIYPALSKLIYVLKQFLHQRDLNEVFTGGLSSYALILLMVNFLQLHPRIDAAEPNVNLGVLLIEFLELYGRNFNFMRTAIRVREGGSLVPKEEIQRNIPEGHQPSLMCIEDPLDQANDVGRSSYGAIVAKNAFEKAYVDLTGMVQPNSSPLPDGKSILSHIISVPDDVIKYRRWISSLIPLAESKHEGFSEDCHPPHHPGPVLAADVYPKDLAERHMRDFPRAHKENSKQGKSREETNGKVDDTDNLSSVSTGTSGHESLALQNGSDSESDVVCLSSSSMSPSSAMSISPATSEVGSIKSQLRPPSGSKSECPFKRGGVLNGSQSKTKPTYWGAGKKDCLDRADMDMNWRMNSSKSASVANSCSNLSSSSSSSAQSFVQPKNNDRADKDSNWRNHHQPNRAGQGETKGNKWKGNKKTKKQGDKTGSSDKPHPLQESNVPLVVDNSEPSESSKELLTSGQKAINKPAAENSQNHDMNDNSASVETNVKKSKKLVKKRKKRGSNVAANDDGAVAAVAASANVSVSKSDDPAGRFSRKSGRCQPNR